MIPANETPRHPHVEPFDWNDELDQRESWLDDPPEPFAFDPLAVAATEYVAAEVRVEPFWKSLLGALGIFVTAFGFCAWAAFGQTPNVDTPTQPADSQLSIREVAKWPGCTEYFPNLPALAARLGVPKQEGADTRGAVVLMMCNGDKYEFIAIINAVLDRIDAAEKLR